MDGSSDRSAPKLLGTLQAVLSRVAKPSQVLKTILAEAIQQTNADRAIFAEVTRTGELAYRVLYRVHRDELAGSAGHFSRGIFARVLEKGQPVLLGNALDDPQFKKNQSIQDFRLVSILCMPIKVESKIASGVFQTEDAKEGPKAFAEKREPKWEAK